jgi:hypothetical protein
VLEVGKSAFLVAQDRGWPVSIIQGAGIQQAVVVWYSFALKLILLVCPYRRLGLVRALVHVGRLIFLQLLRIHDGVADL